jgi:hypothetical protein
MKSFISQIFFLVLAFSSVSIGTAAEISADAIEGKWMFTHMVLDGEREMKVNRLIEFLPDGSAISYDAAGNKKSQATYTISGDNIIYVDSKGKQNWKIIAFDKDSLHVDHRGAEMFFDKQ